MILNPHEIGYDDLPLIVLSDHSSGLIEWIIKWRTKGTYNHIMWLIFPGLLASQGNTYSMVPIERYMRYGNRLKFIEVAGLTDIEKIRIRISIEKKLKLPWWKKLYDWPGILGQALGVTGININGLNYCSEDVVSHLFPCIESVEGDLKEVLSQLPFHGSPEDLNDYFKQHPQHFKIYGRWDSDAKNDPVSPMPFLSWLCCSF